jgi:ATP-dependent helicase/nuclease subunit A
MTDLLDNTERLKALDPTQSFIVQAPAGSGKTTLLTQRFLKLLATVGSPEEILAITFTRKAAGEMHTRVLEALALAHLPEPENAFQKATWQLAKNALKQDQTQGWQLLQNPSRLRIQTIDAFCKSLIKQLPITAHLGLDPSINTQPDAMYEQAFQALLPQIDGDADWQIALRTLSLHLDNQLMRLQSLCVSMLKKRDHWLFHLLHRDPVKTRRHIENSLEYLHVTCFSDISQAFSKTQQVDLLQIISFVQKQLDPTHPLAALNTWPHNSVEDKPQWRAISKLLLTDKGEPRKSLTVANGFPSASSTKDKDEKRRFQDYKTRTFDLLESLSDHTLEQLHLVKQLPDATLSAAQWETIQASLTLLPVLYAQLKIVFAKTGEVDFSEVAICALLALGEPENPSDLSLKLDYQLSHILVDECQDTSFLQTRLLETLTAGWEPDDGRTLFLVGDPMQSIYRFRHAEVGLFLSIQQTGLGQIKPTPIALRCNFRSSSNLINWVNTQFKAIFPAVDDIGEAAVHYHSSTPVKPETQYPAVELNLDLDDRDQESARIVSIIQSRLQANPDERIAILVQARTHLQTVIPALLKANIAFSAVDIVPLQHLAHIKDLIALTKVLHHRLDRTAWLSVLRAPWCGLSLADCHTLSYEDPDQSIWDALQDSSTLSHISAEGQTRLKHLYTLLNRVFSESRRKPMNVCLEDTWTALQAPDYLDSQAIHDCKRFFDCVKSSARGGEIADFDEFLKNLARQFTEPREMNPQVQLMTIHKSKGLEFDTVIIPGLDRRLPGLNPQLLTWLERPRPNGEIDFLLAPIQSADAISDPLYTYLTQFEKTRLAHESRRLFYVAVTRAKTKLHLLATLKAHESAGTFLSYLPKSLKQTDKTPRALSADDEDTLITPPISSIKLDDLTLPTCDTPIAPNTLTPQDAAWSPKEDAALGTLIHRIFETLKHDKPSPDTCRLLLQLHGFDGKTLEKAFEKLQRCIDNILSDKKGQWILSSHPEQFSELHISATSQNDPKHFVMDRVFFDEVSACYWVIDYKTAEPHDTETQADFIERETQLYEPQLKQYTALLQTHFQKDVKAALYFPMMPYFHELDIKTRHREKQSDATIY